MQVTPNYGLKKIELTDSPPDITVHSRNFDIIDAKMKEQSNEINILKDLVVASGTNDYTVTIANLSLVEGVDFKIKFINASTSNPTLNVNGLGAKAIKKASGSPATIKSNSYLKLIYSGTDFILLGEGGEYGTARADVVLQGFTFGTEDGVIDGAAPVVQGYSYATERVVTGGKYQLKPERGYYSGEVWTQISEPDLSAANILAGKTIGGIGGLLEGKKYASGRTRSSSSQYTYEWGYGGTVNGATDSGKNSYYIEISGFDFEPKAAVVSHYQRSEDRAYFGKDLWEAVCFIYCDSAALKFFSRGIKYTNTSFIRNGYLRIPVMNSNVDYDWRVWG